jgi:hypothetical protein
MMESMKMKLIKKIGLHPASPRWLKMYCLNITMRHIYSEFARVIDKMTPEQRDEFNAKLHRNRMEA